MFCGQKEHNDDEIKSVQDFIEQQYQDKINVEQVANHVAVGGRSFERRFKKATNNTVTEYIQRIKAKAAKHSIENSRKNISQVMYDIGYTDTKAFRLLFKKVTGLIPVDYRNKYNKQVMMP